MLTYAAAKPLAGAIARQVTERRMPPWPADSAHSLKFRNDARLSAGEIDTLVRWVGSGAPEGSGLPPPPPADAQAWLFPGGRAPDAILKLAEVSIPARGEMPYVQQRVKVALPADRWIIAMQMRPGNSAIVHHVGITEITAGPGVGSSDLDALAKVAAQMGLPDDALLNTQPAVRDAATNAYDMLGIYTPGTTFEMYGNDSGKLLKSGDNVYVNFNIHFTTDGLAQRNHSELALWFANSRPAHQLFRAPVAVDTLLANGRQLLTDDPGTKAEGTEFAIPPIAPYAANFELVGMTAYLQPLTLYQLQPHAHMRGKNFEYTVVYPDGRQITILSVPKYDFHWQLAYDLETPLQLPAGSKLVVTAHYDNSPANPHMREPGVDPGNCGPDKQAYFRRQNQSWNEMFSPLVQYSVEREALGQAGRVRRVETQGCVVHLDGQSWELAQARKPVETVLPSTSARALAASVPMPPGALRYRLLGVQAFHPQAFGGKRVQVKGALIEDADGARLNVTSLQAVPGRCP